MMTIEELRIRKKELHLTNQEIADLSGVPFATVQKVLAGITHSPRADTMAALEKVLGAEPASYFGRDSSGTSVNYMQEPGWTYGSTVSSAPGAAKKEAAPEKKDGQYTYSDYIALPDDRRVELIDGRFYEMASPNSTHQIIVGELYVQFKACVQKHPGCMVLLSPMDVMLDEDDRTVVQPDLMVFCDLKRLRKGRVFGAPDLVVEVISPGSERIDYFRKTAKYMEAGVKEYWIVDERKGKVIVWVNRQDEGGQLLQEGHTDSDSLPEVTIYGMEDSIPVSISDGSCRIEMAPIEALLKSLGEI